MQENRRFMAVDATRGLAMLCVCISHMHYFLQDVAPALATLMLWVGYIATPTFLLLSGLVAGYQLRAFPDRGTALSILDRGLFVLFVGHVLIIASTVYMTPTWTDVLRFTVITDTIGLLLCGTWLFRFLAPRMQLVVGVVALFGSWAVVLAWQPVTVVGHTVGLLLLGIRFEGSREIGLATPLVPYAGLSLLGMYGGSFVTHYLAVGRAGQLGDLLARTGAAAACLAALAFLAGHTAKLVMLNHAVDAQLIEAMRVTLDPRQKVPPGPAYALFYGGAGLFLVGLLMDDRIRSLVAGPVKFLAVIGRASFVAFVAQQWIIEFIPRSLDFDAKFTPFLAMIYLALSILAVFLVALAWDRTRGNRYLTVGLRPVRGNPRSSGNLIKETPG